MSLYIDENFIKKITKKDVLPVLVLYDKITETIVFINKYWKYNLDI